MPIDTPDCPRCDANRSLEKIRADDKGTVWCYCTVCSTTVLLNAAGKIVHIGGTQ